MTFPAASTDRVLSIYTTLAQYPILRVKIRARMRRELFERGVISPQQFEAEVREKAIQSQARERLAALHRLPYDILDRTGKVLVSGQTSELSRELPPGEYRIKVDALGQVLEDSLTIVANETTSIGLGVEGDRFVIRR